MATIGRLWAGKLYGTNTGNLAAEINGSDKDLSGVFRFLDDRFGPVVFELRGTFDGTTIDLAGAATQAPEGILTGNVTVKGTLTAEGQLRGEWSSSLGTGGTFHLFPHDVTERAPLPAGALPEQLHTATRALGALRLYADDVRQLIQFLHKDFSQGRVVVTYYERGNEISKYATDFLADLGRLGELRYLKLHVQEPEAYGINRLATVELSARGSNDIRVQGIQESWVVGKAEALASHLRLRQKALSTTVRKFGLNINGLIAIAALALLPELPLGRRIVFVVVVVLVTWMVGKLHERFIPNALVQLSDVQPSTINRAWPQILSWLIAASAGLVSAIAYGLLKGELGDLVRWFAKLFT